MCLQMRAVVLVTFLGLVALTAVASSPGDGNGEQGATDGALGQALGSPRPRRWVVFRPMFATRARQRALNRASARHDLRRQSRQRDRRPKRALHFPVSAKRPSAVATIVVCLNFSTCQN